MNPATGSVYAHLPNSVPEDVEAAVSSAEAAYPAWSSLSHEARAPVLLKCVNIAKCLLTLTTDNDCDDCVCEGSLS